ncbi:MAG: ferrochelatase [Sulfuritalea sp.]|nr:ferrochelatase [Sulfuritalea sp.]MDP1982676.1 ferrochelatase [Sulfuritalea sp.]
MPRYSPEPAPNHGAPRRTAVLLVNLGTPEAPTAAALRRYLKQFLWDPRVVEIPRPVWWLILNGIILNLRPAKSAAKYAQIWMPDGSPLKGHTERQARLLKGWLGEAGNPAIVVNMAMRYGQPSIAGVLDQFKRDGVERVLVLPLYPQYAASSTASVMDDVADWIKRSRNPLEIRFVKQFHDHPGYIAALAASVKEHWAANGRPDKLVMSFHGLPRRSLDLGDPYYCQCQKTGRLLAEALGLAPEQFLITFQSRFGKAEWLQPYTQATLERLGADGTARVDVICPGFVADCLETLEEIALECKAAFLSSGGKEFHYIPCVNERPDWIAALGQLVSTHLGGWPLAAQSDPAAAARARALGAKS